MLKLRLSKDSVKFVKKLPPKQQRQIGLKIQELRKNKGSHDSRPLKGFPYLRADVGEYRIIYEIENDVLLLILLIGKRNDDEVYRRLVRK